MACPTYLYLADPSGAIWRVAVTDIGILTTTLAQGNSPQILNLTDYISRTTSWSVTISVGGILNQVPIALNLAYITRQVVFSSSFQWFLTVTPLGILQTIQGQQRVSTWQVGTQYDPKYNGINWSQPGGAFTKVFPQQVTGNSNLLSTSPFNELTGTFILGCGHSVDQADLQQEYDALNCVQVMLVMCPTCSYISRVISPATLAFNPLTNAIITP